MRVFSDISCHTYMSPMVRPPKEPLDPIKGLNCGQNSDLIKMKFIVWPDPVA